MSIDWDGYEPYELAALAPPNLLPRAEARRLFEQRIQSRHARIEMLRRLVAANGVVLGTDDAAIQDLNDWFLNSIEADPEHPGALLPMWYSVCHDVALFLGEVMIERHPHLHWEFFTWGKKNVSFQHHVLMGLSTEDPKFHTNIDIDRMVMTYAHRIIAARGSIRTYGLVEVRGHLIDVDDVAAEHRPQEVESQRFWDLLRIAARRA